MKTAWVWRMGALRPYSPEAVEQAAKWRPGTSVLCEATVPRNVQHHKLAFTLFRTVWENTDRWDTADHFRRWLLCQTGNCDTVPLSDGTVMAIPHSMSFQAMGNDEFRDFWNRALDVIIQDVIPGANREDLEREVYGIIGIDYERAA